VEIGRKRKNYGTIVAIVLIVIAAFVARTLTSKGGRYKISPYRGFSAVGSVRTINSAALTYKMTYSNGFPANLGVLAADGTGIKSCDRAQYIDGQLASRLESGYSFTYRPRPPLQQPAQGCTFPGASGYTLNADPLDFDDPGKRHFFTDQTEVIRYEFGKQAAAASPELE
jgi:type IV pilus assembly protein PilA